MSNYMMDGFDIGDVQDSGGAMNFGETPQYEPADSAPDWNSDSSGMSGGIQQGVEYLSDFFADIGSGWSDAGPSYEGAQGGNDFVSTMQKLLGGVKADTWANIIAKGVAGAAAASISKEQSAIAKQNADTQRMSAEALADKTKRESMSALSPKITASGLIGSVKKARGM